MRKRILAVTISVTAIAAFMGESTGALADHGPHNLSISGISTIQNQCQYEWARDANGEPIRDDLGIPKPSQLPPPCRTSPGGQTVSCSLKRNLGTYPPHWRPADVTKGEVGLNPPCAGNLTFASFPGLQGCVDASTEGPNCSLNAPTWFYGYCGQTYGGATGGSLEFGGDSWVIEKLGFTRARGTWEFGARIKKGSTTEQARFFFNAAPDKLAQGEGIACDGGPPITSVAVVGQAMIPAPPAKIFRTAPGWHYCHNDPVTGVSTDIC